MLKKKIERKKKLEKSLYKQKNRKKFKILKGPPLKKSNPNPMDFFSIKDKGPFSRITKKYN